MIISDWKNMLASARYFLKLIFISKEYDVVFMSSAFFNRGEAGENLLLKPMIEFCKKNNISYAIIEDTDLKGEYKSFVRNKESIPFDFISLLQIFFRKIYNLIVKKPTNLNEEYARDLKISSILKSLFFKRFSSKVYLTLLWNNVTLWRRISPNACIADYQHGIIFDGHRGYVIDGNPPHVKSSNEVFTLVYGGRFKNLLIENDNSGFYNEKNVIRVGLNKIIDKPKITSRSNKKILFTLQITADFQEKEFNKQYVQIVEKLIDNNAEFLSSNNYQIIFRHHPRYSSNECPQINIEYDFVSFDNKTPMADLLSNVSIHITFNSTSAFDAAMMGRPTIFIDMHDPQSPTEIFFNQYIYPLQDWVIKDYEDLKYLLIEADNQYVYDNSCMDVYEWSKGFYQDFDERIFRDFILEQINNGNGHGGLSKSVK